MRLAWLLVIAALCPAIVLEDNDKARAIGIRGQRYFMESLAYWYAGGERPDPEKWKDDTFVDGNGQAVGDHAPLGKLAGLGAGRP